MLTCRNNTKQMQSTEEETASEFKIL